MPLEACALTSSPSASPGRHDGVAGSVDCFDNSRQPRGQCTAGAISTTRVGDRPADVLPEPDIVSYLEHRRGASFAVQVDSTDPPREVLSAAALERIAVAPSARAISTSPDSRTLGSSNSLADAAMWEEADGGIPPRNRV